MQFILYLCSDLQLSSSVQNHSHTQQNIIFITMDYDARKDSLLSEQESEKVQLYFTITHLQAQQVYLDIYIQQTNQPRKKLKQTKPQHQQQGGHLDFPESLVIDYFFEIRQRIIVDVVTTNRQIIGGVNATVGEIFNGRDAGVKKDIEGGGHRVGQMILRGEKVEQGTSKFIQYDLVARNVDVGSAFLCFGESGCQWKLFKVKRESEYLLYQSEIREGKNNRFNKHRINEKKICNNNYKQPIIIRFYTDSGSVIGESRFDLATLHQGRTRFTLMKGGKEKGVFALENFKQSIKYDFMDYLRNGMQMAMVVCIDFTASNGIQTQGSSLHYITNNKRSQYEEALNQTCAIVLDYDTDKLVPCFGFGAKVNMPGFSTGGKVHHCFPLNGSEQNPNLFQLGGIIEGYRKCLPFLSFSGPTYFAPLLRQAMGVCQSMKNQTKQYMVLMIMTDGIIHDKQQVKDLLVKCGKLPLSIIIIGIGAGEDDWKAMHELDDDDCLMTDFQGNPTQRDLVQFVEFRKHNNNGVELAKQVLQELPRQVEEYHQLVHLTPQVYTKHLNQDILYQQGH